MNGGTAFNGRVQREEPGKRTGSLASGGTAAKRSVTSISSVLQPEEILAGTGVAEWCPYGHDAEMEWCLIFSRPLSRLQIDEKVQCYLQGAIRERQLNPSVNDRRGSGGDSRGRTIIAMNGGEQRGTFGGIRTSIGELTGGMALGRMRLEYMKENMMERVDRSLSSSILFNLPLIDSLKELQQKAASNNGADTNIIRLHPPGNCGGYVKERWLKYRSAFTAVNGSCGNGLLHSKIWHQLITDVVTRREYIKNGTTARLDVFDSKGTNMGTSFLEVK